MAWLQTHIYVQMSSIQVCACLLSAADMAQGHHLSPLHPTSGLLAVFPPVGTLVFFTFTAVSASVFVQTSKKLHLLLKRKTAPDLREHMKCYMVI